MNSYEGVRLDFEDEGLGLVLDQIIVFLSIHPCS